MSITSEKQELKFTSRWQTARALVVGWGHLQKLRSELLLCRAIEQAHISVPSLLNHSVLIGSLGRVSANVCVMASGVHFTTWQRATCSVFGLGSNLLGLFSRSDKGISREQNEWLASPRPEKISDQLGQLFHAIKSRPRDNIETVQGLGYVGSNFFGTWGGIVSGRIFETLGWASNFIGSDNQTKIGLRDRFVGRFAGRAQNAVAFNSEAAATAPAETWGSFNRRMMRSAMMVYNFTLIPIGVAAIRARDPFMMSAVALWGASNALRYCANHHVEDIALEKAALKEKIAVQRQMVNELGAPWRERISRGLQAVR